MLTVNWELPDPVVTAVGDKEHVALVGQPETVSPTVPAYPFSAETVMVEALEEP